MPDPRSSIFAATDVLPPLPVAVNKQLVFDRYEIEVYKASLLGRKPPPRPRFIELVSVATVCAELEISRASLSKRINAAIEARAEIVAAARGRMMLEGALMADDNSAFGPGFAADAREWRRQRDRAKARANQLRAQRPPWPGADAFDVAEAEAERARGDGAGEPDVDIATLPVVSAASFAGKTAPPRPWHVPAVIPSRQVTLLTGDGGVGKSIVAMMLGVSTAAMLQWLGMTPTHGAVLYLSAEDDLDEIHRRLEAISANYGVNLADLANFHLIALAGKDAVLAAPSKAGVIAATTVFRGLVSAVKQIKPRLVIIDTSADVYAGNEINRSEVRQFIGLLRGVAIDEDSRRPAARSPEPRRHGERKRLERIDGMEQLRPLAPLARQAQGRQGEEIAADLRFLIAKRSNYGPADLKFRLRWQRGCFAIDGRGREDFDKAVDEARCEAMFVNVLADLIGQGAICRLTAAPALRRPSSPGIRPPRASRRRLSSARWNDCSPPAASASRHAARPRANTSGSFSRRKRRAHDAIRTGLRTVLRTAFVLGSNGFERLCFAHPL